MDPSRENRGGRSAAARARAGWLDVIWQYAATTRAVGGLILLAGVLMMSAPLGKMPRRQAEQWWDWAFQSSESLQVVVLLLIASAPLWIGVWLMRQRGAHTADVVLCEAPELPARAPSANLPLYGILVMAIGGLGVFGLWLSIQRDVPPTRAAFSIGQQTEYVLARVGGRSVRMMLPRRVTVTDLQWGEEKGLTLEFARAGQTDVAGQSIEVGQSVEVGGKRFTFIGIQDDPETLRAMVSSSAKDTIPAGARKGESFRVALNGPEFTITDMELNYIGMMGPAVQLESEETGAFWLFLRAPREQFGPAFEHDLKLDALETMPAAVMTVSPVMPFEPLIAFGLIFVAGLGMTLTFPERRRRGKRGLLSINEAGPLAQGYAPVSTAQDRDYSQEEE